MSFTVFINAGPWLPIPPPGYGGIENMLLYLIRELRERYRHRVILGTVGSSQIAVDHRVSRFPSGQHRHIVAPYCNTVSLAHAHMRQMMDTIEDTPEIDIVHDFMEIVGPSLLVHLDGNGPPVLHTLQGDLARHEHFYRDFDGKGKVVFNGISEPQMEAATANLRRQALGVIHNGVDVADFHYRSAKEPYVLTFGRMAREKGQHVAARVCARVGLPLRMAGPVSGIDSPANLERELATDGPVRTLPDVQYYLECVRPLERERNPEIRWVGTVGGRDKRSLIAGARALLMPVQWEEPFGMAAIEALASGTPVVAMRRGAMPVIVKHGQNGFLADDEHQLADALTRLGEIRAEECRKSVEPEFTASAMAAGYDALYRKVIERAKSRSTVDSVTTQAR